MRALLAIFALMAVAVIAAGLNRGGPTESPDALPLAAFVLSLALVMWLVAAAGRAGGRRSK